MDYETDTTEARRERAEERRAARQQEEADFLWLMSNERGRRIVYRLLELSGVFNTTYQPAAGDITSEMLFREGMKNLGYRIFRDIHALCPALYVRMIKERKHGRTGSNAAD